MLLHFFFYLVFIQFQGADTQPTLEKHLTMYLLLTLKDIFQCMFEGSLLMGL